MEWSTFSLQRMKNKVLLSLHYTVGLILNEEVILVNLFMKHMGTEREGSLLLQG